MSLDDIGPYCHGERVRHYLRNLTGHDHCTKTTTLEELRCAEGLATAEMLDEIHLMLRKLHGKE